VRFKTLSLLATACAVASGIFALIAPAASAASIGGFGARPAHFDPNNAATRAYFIRSVPGGGQFTDQVIAFNSESKPVTLRVYPVDGLTGATSGVVYGNRGVRLRSAGLWVTPATSMVTVPPHSQTPVPFTVRVPKGSSSGQHLAGLALEDVAAGKSAGRFSVTEVLRTVVGIEINVPGAAQSHLALRSFSIAPIQGTNYPALMVGIANTGGVLCKPALSVSLNGPAGTQHDARQLDTVLPGDVIAYPFAWPRALSAGTYNATITATGCGRPVVLRGSASLGQKLAANTVPAAETEPPSSDTLPWWPIALVGFAGLLIGGMFGRRRRGPRTD
jgi:hypothetical protein